MICADLEFEVNLGSKFATRMEEPPWTAVNCDRGATRKNSTNNHWSLFHAIKSLCLPLVQMIFYNFFALLELWLAFELEFEDRKHGVGRNMWSGPAPNPTTCDSGWCSPRTAGACSIGATGQVYDRE